MKSCIFMPLGSDSVVFVSMLRKFLGQYIVTTIILL
jgi:hypothetical protein